MEIKNNNIVNDSSLPNSSGLDVFKLSDKDIEKLKKEKIKQIDNKEVILK